MLVRMPGQRLARIASRVVVVVSVAVQLAVAQSGDRTAEAKQHYQKAVAAIDKNDWQTAKSELLQAEKLAPNNALVHYDLALAYSHTGQVTLAKAELNKAFQLGLPPENKKAAEELRQQLMRSISAPKVSEAEKRPSFERKDNGPWVFITLDFPAQDMKIAFTMCKPASNGTCGGAAQAEFIYNGGCNSWFSGKALFVIDQNLALSIPGPAQCPLPPRSRNVSVFFLEALASAQQVSGSVDGLQLAFSKEQLDGIKNYLHDEFSNIDGQPAFLGGDFNPFNAGTGDRSSSAHLFIQQRLGEYANQQGQRSCMLSVDNTGIAVNRIWEEIKPLGSDMSGKMHQEVNRTTQWADLAASEWNSSNALTCSNSQSDCVRRRVEVADRYLRECSNCGWKLVHTMTQPTDYGLTTPWDFFVDCGANPVSSQEFQGLNLALGYLWFRRVYVVH